MKRLFRNNHFKRFLMIAPPIFFLLYMAHSVIVIRSLLSSSSRFHQDYANDLVQDYLGMAIALDIEAMKRCMDLPDCQSTTWLSKEPVGEPIAELANDSNTVTVYLNYEKLPETLREYISSRPGLNSLFARLRYHEPVYWARILDPQGQVVYTSGESSHQEDAIVYEMTRSLKGFTVEIVYTSFGPQQLYSVSRQKINFGLILFLFLFAVFSGVLVTRSIRQKILWARQKSFFATTVSHEFKTPLAIMRLAAETLESKRYKTQDEEKRFLKMMTNEINRLNHLVQTILNFGKMEMGQFRFQEEEVELGELLESCLAVFGTKAEAEGITLNVNICEDSCYITGDPDLIRHALDNIIENAFKYRGESKEIDLTCERQGDKGYLRVRDYGLGIAEDELPLIQRSFYRVEDPATTGIRGSGLGLAIASYILSNSNASLEIESEYRKGSVFSIVFTLNEEG